MKKKFKYIVTTILLMLLWAGVIFTGTVSGWFHKPITRQNTLQSFLTAVDVNVNKQFTGNFAMAVLKKGIVSHEKFYSAGQLVDRNTVFQVASLSKWISAFGIMKLVEDGTLALDTPVSKYLTRWQLPSSKFNNQGVTVRRLLSHTAGLTDGLGYSGFEPGTSVQTLEQSLTKAADADEESGAVVRVGIEPGSQFIYSGGGYTLLQLLVEEVTGESFDAYMKESVFDPLGMNHSSYIWDDHANDTLAEFYNADGTRSPHYRYTALAATSLYTSLSDLELFFQAHFAGRNDQPVGRNIIKPETVKMMREPHAQAMGIDIWGLGTVLYAPTDNDFIIGHDGKSTPPVNTAVRLNPQTGDGIIVLATGNSHIATKLASEWVFWKTGQVDTFLFPMLMGKLFWMTGIGWILIICMSITIYAARYQLKNKSSV